jgi:hypothetical protein
MDEFRKRNFKNFGFKQMILNIFHRNILEEPRANKEDELDMAMRKLRKADVYVNEATCIFEQYIKDFKRQRGINE